jgi:uncharacterized membrane protein
LNVTASSILLVILASEGFLSHLWWCFLVIGAIATAGVLCAGLLAFRKGDFNRSQQMMRARVGFQAATVALMVGTVYLQGKT